MSSVTTYDLIHDFLVDNFTAVPLAFENDGFKQPSDPEHYVYVEIVGNYLDQASIGAENVKANLWRELGVVYLNVMAPRGAGSRQARVYATQLSDLFRGLELGPLIFREGSIGEGEPGRTDGSYYRMTATIDWQRDA